MCCGVGSREHSRKGRRSFMTGSVKGEEFSSEEVKLALRNPGMHLEGMRYPITPIGMHYLLIHFDIPLIDPVDYELRVSGCGRTPLGRAAHGVKARPAVT